MRILITGTTYYPALNGQAVFMTNLAEGLARHGHQVMVLHPYGRPKRTTINDVQVEITNSISLTFIHPYTYIPIFYNSGIQHIFESFQPEIIHIQDHYPLSRKVMQEAIRRRIRVIGTNHFSPENLTPYLPGSKIFSRLYDRVLWAMMTEVYNHLDVVTAPSRSAVDLMLRKGLSAPAFPVSCGTDLASFRPDPTIDQTACRRHYGLDPDKLIFLYVGRLDREKKIDILLRALHEIRRDDLQLAIAGEGAAEQELLALAQKLNLGNRVRFTKYVRREDLSVLLNSVDVFAMPGETESFSIASVEAMACGLPILAANSCALPDLVEYGVNGYLFKPGDPTDAALHMNRLAEERQQLKAMGEASLSKARPHSLENTIQKYEAFYSRLLERSHEPIGITKKLVRSREKLGL